MVLLAMPPNPNANAAVPSAPTQLTAAASSSQITLRWTNNATNADGVKVERKVGSGGVWTQLTTVAATSSAPS